MPAAVEDLKKLTVPQLKALCKDKKIIGYSKLGKNAVIQKLVEHFNSVGSLPPSSSSGVVTPLAVAPPQIPTSTIAEVVAPSNPKHAPVFLEQHVGINKPCIEYQVIPNDEQQVVLPCEPKKTLAQPTNNDDTSTLVRTSVSFVTHKQTSPVGQLARKQLAHGKKRPFEVSEPTNIPSKHRKPLNPAEPSFSTTLHPVFKVPAIPAFRDSISKPPLASPHTVARPVDPTVATHSLQPTSAPSQTTTVKKFVPLVVKKATSTVLSNVPYVVQPSPKVYSVVVASASLWYLDFPVPQQLSLETISLPPSLSQRKMVTRLAILLSGISVEQLRKCAQVSRLFRYAAYISAVHRLSRSFSGRRLDLIMSQYSPKMTNMWPYQRHRQDEFWERQRIYCDSFLGRALNQDRISKRLWTSPDSAKQATVAVRFLLTRFFFSISTGTENTIDFGIVIDAQELVEGEVWSITTRSFSSTEVLYVLEATCEVVGHPPLPPDQSGLSQPLGGRQIPLRADWSAYIESRTTQPSAAGRTPSLIEHLKWTNHEEYEQGISKLWLKRIQNESELGAAKLIVAERYILACVVGNSVSGRWMSSSEMAQEFNGLSSRVSSSKPNFHLHLFLPAHHHVESLHFVLPNGRPLHPALAAVQTPGREYYILRDNGMQVGCEEEGVALVWMGLLGCDALGRPNPSALDSY